MRKVFLCLDACLLSFFLKTCCTTYKIIWLVPEMALYLQYNKKQKSMKRINSYNVMDELVNMYVFHIVYCAPKEGRYFKKCSIESSPFNYKETCLGAMRHEIDVLQAKGAVITSCYVESVLVPDTEKQF